MSSSALSAATMSPVAALHFRQKQSWDCGIACGVAATAILEGVPEAEHDALYDELKSCLPSESIWSVELAMALQSRGLRPAFHSTVLGVNEAHANLSFYTSVLPEDRPRVSEMFARARDSMLPMEQHHVELDYICDKLSKLECLFIALLDLRKLRCSRCIISASTFQFTFAGHYVLAVGYSYESDSIAYLDPAVCHSSTRGRGPYCYMKAADFEAARMTAGTDEDLIELSRGAVPESAEAGARAGSGREAAAGSTEAGGGASERGGGGDDRLGASAARHPESAHAAGGAARDPTRRDMGVSAHAASTS